MEELVCARIFFVSLASVFLYCKGFQKSNGPPLKFNPLSNNRSDWLKGREEGDRLQFMCRKLRLE